MKKMITMAALITAMCVLGGCASSKDKAKEATTETQKEETGYIPVEVKASDYVELGDYKGLTVEMEPVNVTDEEVQEEVEYLAQQYAEYEKVEDRDDVREGDYINIDYTGTIDGKESADYSDSDIDVYVSGGELNSYFGTDLGDDVDIESKVIGTKVGKSTTVEFTFPKDSEDTEIAGKKCSVKITVNAIQKEIIPELTDAFIKENTDCDTLAEYKKQTRKELEETYSSDAEDTCREDLMTQIVNDSTMKKDFTEDMIKQEVTNLKIQNEEYSEYFGLSVEEFIEQSSGMTLEECAADSLKRQCVQELLVDAEKLEVTDEELDAQIDSLVEEGGYASKEDLLEYYPEENIRSDALYEKLMENLMSYSEIKEKSPEASTESEAE